jgi:hypothetical protein
MSLIYIQGIRIGMLVSSLFSFTENIKKKEGSKNKAGKNNDYDDF